MIHFIRFDIYFIAIAATWIIGSILLAIGKYRKLKVTGHIFLNVGFVLLTTFLILLWIYLQRAPIQSYGETRLWFGLFFAGTGYSIYIIRKYKWFLVFNLFIALAILYINVYYPENLDKTQLPAQQSHWYFFYKIACILAYAFFIATSHIAFMGLLEIIRKKSKPETLLLANNMVFIGFSILTCAVLLGGLWSKQTIDHFWAWTEAEIWIVITWFVYLIYIHLRNYHNQNKLVLLIYLAIACMVPVVSWIGDIKHLIHLFAN